MLVAPTHGLIAAGIGERVLELRRAGIVDVDHHGTREVRDQAAVRDVKLPVTKAEAAAVEIKDHDVARTVHRVVEVQINPANLGANRTLHACIGRTQLVAVRTRLQLLAHAIRVDVLILHRSQVGQLLLTCHIIPTFILWSLQLGTFPFLNLHASLWSCQEPIWERSLFLLG